MKINEIFGGGTEFRKKIRGVRGDNNISTNPTPANVRTYNPDPNEFQPDPDEDFRARNRLYRDPNAEEKLEKSKSKTKKISTKSSNKQNYDYTDPRSQDQDGNYLKGTTRSMDDTSYLGNMVQTFVKEYKNQCENPNARGIPSGNNETYTPKIRIEKVTGDGKYNYSLDLVTKNGIEINVALNSGQERLPNKARIYFKGGLKEKESAVLSALDEQGIKWTRDGGEGTKTAPSVDLNTVVTEATQKSNDQFTQENLLTLVKDKLKNFWKVVNVVEDMGENFELPSTRKIYKAIKRKPSHMRYYIGAALLMMVAVKFKLPNLLARGGSNGKNNDGLFDVRDEDITVAYSKEGKDSVTGGGGRWREHLVPCDYIQNMAVTMINNHQSSEVIDMKLVWQVADMIRRNLVIAIISNDQHKILDEGPGNLKSTMPTGWKDGDSVLARLDHFGIQVFSADDGTPLNNPVKSQK